MTAIFAPTDFYPAYIQTYVERDVRLMKNIGDINTFIQFTRLCAGRIGQQLNYAQPGQRCRNKPEHSQSMAFYSGELLHPVPASTLLP